MKSNLIKKPFLMIPLVMGTAIGLVIILAWATLKEVNAPTDFKREFISQPLKPVNIMDIPREVVDFAGVTNDHIYFKTLDPAKVFNADIKLQTNQFLTIDIPNDKAIASRFNCIVDSPFVYILAGNVPSIIKTHFQGGTTTYKFPGTVFTRAALLPNNLFALRLFEKTDQIFAKGNPATGELTKENNISEKLKDGGISTDGVLVYDKHTGSIIYIHYFKNEILFMDTSLNLIRKIKTIDINSNSSVKAGEGTSKDILTNLSPKRLINAAASVDKGLLFINSRTKADNQEIETFNSNSAIDIYNVNDGTYAGSFNIPYYKGERLYKFKVADDKIFVMYNNYLVSYDLPELTSSNKKAS
jgi:hypothetical protein